MLELRYFTDTSIRTEIYATATLQTDFGMAMGFSNSFQLPPGTTSEQVAFTVLEWAVAVAMYREGQVEVECDNPPTGEIKLNDAPNLKVTFKKAVTESLSPMVSGIALLG